MDSDTELTFYPDRSVHMFEWGYTLSSYTGVYHAHPDGCVVAMFENFNQTWPVMVVYRDGDALLLRPWDPNVDFIMGNRAGATLPDGATSYWPFRMLTGDEEKEVLNRINKTPESSAP